MRRRYKIILVIIITLVLVIGGLTAYMFFFRKIDKTTENVSNIIHTIEKFDYSLEDRDTDLMKEEFYGLEKILKAEEIDYSLYAQSLSKLFIIDVFTIDNKSNKYDIGGLEYLLKEEQEKFKNILIDTLYANVIDDSNSIRKQDLPIVKNVSVINITEDTYLLKDEPKEAYNVNMLWEYKKDLGYDSKACITLIKEENKLFIVEYNSVIETQEENEK